MLRTILRKPVVDLRSKMPLLFEQGDLGSCTAHAIATLIMYEMTRLKYVPPAPPSRLFIYYNERKIENCIDEDSGAMLRDGFKSCAHDGICDENLWPYVIDRFKEKPPDECYEHAKQWRLKKYMRIDNRSPNFLNILKTCLAGEYPFVCGITVYESFESDHVAEKGRVPMPDKNKEMMLGGHAVTCVGYNDNERVFIMRNSWGEHWGDKGHFYLPYEYIANPELATDFWTIRLLNIDDSKRTTC
jgi:C1A family cysteine protease